MACVKPVLCLLKVVSLWVLIDIVGNLIDARQRVKDSQVVFASVEHGIVQGVEILHTLILHEVGETLALYAGHIENVGFVDNLL